MKQSDIILIEASSPDFGSLQRAMQHAEETFTYIRFYVDHDAAGNAILKWKSYEGEWSAGTASHRPNGGY